MITHNVMVVEGLSRESHIMILSFMPGISHVTFKFICLGLVFF